MDGSWSVRGRIGLSLCVMLGGFSLGCSDDSEAAAAATAAAAAAETAEAAAAEAAAVEAAAVEAVRGAMGQHFAQAREARRAIIAGDIESAREAMRFLAANDLGGTLPEALQPRFAAMQEAARAFGSAENLREAGTALATTLTRCGECHEAAGRGPSFEAPTMPAGDDVRTHMQRHRWGAERMWEGLVLRSAETFERGAQALDEEPLRGNQLPAGEVGAERIDALAAHAHQVAGEAAEASTDPARAQAYGNLLATCASCHRALNVQIPAAQPAP